MKSSFETKNGISVIAKRVEITNLEATKDLVFQLKIEIENLFLVFGSVADGKAMLTIVVDEKLIEFHKLNVSNIVREAAKEIEGGGGGGQPFYATTGGKNPTGLHAAIAKAISILG